MRRERGRQLEGGEEQKKKSVELIFKSGVSLPEPLRLLFDFFPLQLEGALAHSNRGLCVRAKLYAVAVDLLLCLQT